MVETSISVGLGELVVSTDPSIVLAAHGLGSCIGVLAYDRIGKIAGLSHVLLPDSTISRDKASPGKFADTAVPLLINEMIKEGALKSRIIIKLAGGAQMFSIPGMSQSMNIGLKNINAVRDSLKELGLSIRAEDVGGSSGRSVKLRVENGYCTLRKTGFPEREFL